MPPRSLVEMTIHCAQRNIANIDDFGYLPYELMAPILRKVQNPAQLQEIEKNNPETAEKNADLWKEFIRRDIINWEQKIFEPPTPSQWGKVYRALQRSEAELKKAAEARLEAAFADNTGKPAKTEFLRKVVPQRAPITNVIDGQIVERKQRTPALKNAKSGFDICAAIRKESASASKERTCGIGKPRTFNSFVPPVKQQITKAPHSMVKEYQDKSPAGLAAAEALRMKYMKEKGPPPPSRVFAPKTKQTWAHKQFARTVAADQHEKEERLRALTTPGYKPSSTYVASVPTYSATYVSPVRTTTGLRPSTPVASPPRAAPASVSPPSTKTRRAGLTSASASTSTTTNSRPIAQHSAPRADPATTARQLSPETAAPTETARARQLSPEIATPVESNPHASPNSPSTTTIIKRKRSAVDPFRSFKRTRA